MMKQKEIKMKSKIKIVLIVLLFFGTLCVTTASAKDYYVSKPTGSLTISATSNDIANIYYTPSEKGTRTFTMSNDIWHQSVVNVATVSFAWAYNYGAWNSPWATYNYKNSLSVKLYSGSNNIRYKIVVKPIGLAYVNANVKFS